MPKRAKHRPARPFPVQLPLFAEAASLARIRPERNEWRLYRMEIFADLFGRALLLRQWGRIGTEGRRRLDPASRSGFSAFNALTMLRGKNGDAVTWTAPHDQVALCPQGTENARRTVKQFTAEECHPDRHSSPKTSRRRQQRLLGGDTP